MSETLHSHGQTRALACEAQAHDTKQVVRRSPAWLMSPVLALPRLWALLQDSLVGNESISCITPCSVQNDTQPLTSLSPQHCPCTPGHFRCGRSADRQCLIWRVSHHRPLLLLLGGDSCMKSVLCQSKVHFSSLAGTAALHRLRGNGSGGDLTLLVQCEQLASEEFSSLWVFKQQRPILTALGNRGIIRVYGETEAQSFSSQAKPCSSQVPSPGNGFCLPLLASAVVPPSSQSSVPGFWVALPWVPLTLPRCGAGVPCAPGAKELSSHLAAETGSASQKFRLS